MKISKATREAAANLCSMRASLWAHAVDAPEFSILNISEMGAPVDVSKLAYIAFAKAPSMLGGGAAIDEACSLEWAEAEAMLREGWTP